ncbi:mitotic interactor and substrate of PLK1 [Sarcophilus harrisii]|uniref:mitotic interactor and substrate of PLK1 n=1 Tax=Sarcophilus harrisii TaxID=9305 RepID=UPI001301D3AC|nr:mitotic interactor and substrate of PLK1 [Sarcophilus harrisii]
MSCSYKYFLSQRAQSCPFLLDEESPGPAPELREDASLEKGPGIWEESAAPEAPNEMDRVTRYPIFNIPHSSRVSDLSTDLESHYTFDVVKVESMSPSWDKDIRGMDSGGQSFRFDPEETSALRVVTVTQEIVPMSHLVKKTQHVVTDNYSAKRPTPSWERKTQREVVKVGPNYSLRAWPGERQPGRLFSQEEEEGEQQLYLLGPGENAFPKGMEDFEREREAVIRGQVVKRSTTVATRWSSQEELDGFHPGQGPSSISASDSDSVIDTDQINFLAARQQFLNLEKLTASSQPAQKPTASSQPAQKPREKTMQPTVIQTDAGQSISSSGSGRAGLTNGHTVSIRDDAEEVRSGLHTLAPSSRSISVDHLSVSSVDDALTLVSAEGPELVPCDEGPKETPIEREIRRAQEREADLRQQRGLQQSGSQAELVEIPIRPLLSTVNLTFTSTAKKGKDKGRPLSLYIQREIALDTKREEDHRQQAGLSELISDGRTASTPNQRAKDSEFPKIRRVQSSDSILSLTSDTHPKEANLEGKKISRIPLKAYQPYLNPHSTKKEFPSKEFPSYSSYKPGSSLGSGHLTMSSRWEQGVTTPPPSSRKVSWREEQVKEQPWQSQTPTWREEQVREQSWKSQTPTWREEQVREQSWKSQTPTWREEQFREQSWKSQTPSWREEQVREQPWQSQTPTWREEQIREKPWKSQTSTWREEQVREQPWKSQTSTTQRQEPWRSPPQKITQKAWDAQERVAGDASRGVVLRDYFHLRPMKLKFTFIPGPEKVSAPKQERVWQPKISVKEEATIHTKPLRSQSSSLLEMEIQNVLQRERELEEERRNALFPEVFSPTEEMEQTFEWEDSHSRHSSVASGITGSYSLSESPTFSPVCFHSNLVWKVTDQSPGQDKSWKKRDVGYAGLDTSDTVDLEIMEATRVTRHKNYLAARWEAGMYACEDED